MTLAADRAMTTTTVRVAPLVVVVPARRPRKDYSRGRLRMNLKETPKARALPGVEAIARGE